MILAAGKGTRVRPITYTIPKPLIPILQKPVMEFLLDLLAQHGFDQIMVNVSHLATKLKATLRMVNATGYIWLIPLKAVSKTENYRGLPSVPPGGCGRSKIFIHFLTILLWCFVVML